MEEKNNERKKILLVIAIFIVLIAISVGGVYAYFSARATNSGQEITGRTLDINGSTLTIAASRLNLNPSPAPVSDNLLPAKFGVDPTEMTTTQVNKALSKQCVVGGYTGCHVWKITASTTQDVPTANIRLNLNVNTVTDKDEWSYVVYTGTDSSAGAVLNKGLINTDFGNTTNTIDIHNGASLSTGTPAVYYVMVYLNNTNSVQNDGTAVGTTNETGAYNGSVILEAMGGEVKVNFYEEEEQEATPISDFTYAIGTFDYYETADDTDDDIVIPAGEVLLLKYNGSDTVINIPSTYIMNGIEYIPIVYGDGPASEESTFYANENITEVNFANGVLFADLDNGESLTFNTMLGLFTGCTNLVSISGIPNSITSMSGTFSNCTSLVNAPEIPSSVTNLNGTFFGCTSLVDAPVIPSSVTSLNVTFSGCTSLINAPEIPSSVTSMNNTFAGCTNLEGAIRINSSLVNNVSNTFRDTTKNITLEVPSGSTTYNSFNGNVPANVTISPFTP